MPSLQLSRPAYLPLPPLSEIDADLFWSLVDKRQPDECWEWQDNLTAGGYGQFRVNYRALQATRVSYYLTHHVDPLALVVRHKCDHPPCVNPNHLELGDQKDNMRDAVIRGRLNCGDKNGTRTKPESKALGERNGLSKLTCEVVQLIRERYASGSSCESLAYELGVMGSLIQKIVHGIIWKKAGGPIFPGKLRKDGDRAPNVLLTREQAQRVVDLRVEGKTGEQICAELGCSQGAIWPILDGNSWKDLDRSKLDRKGPKKQIPKSEWPAIFDAKSAGETTLSLATRYNVGKTAIQYILTQYKKTLD